MRRVKGNHWYKTFTTECPVCGRTETIKELQYGTPPVRWDPQRYQYERQYDWCEY